MESHKRDSGDRFSGSVKRRVGMGFRIEGSAEGGVRGVLGYHRGHGEPQRKEEEGWFREFDGASTWIWGEGKVMGQRNGSQRGSTWQVGGAN